MIDKEIRNRLISRFNAELQSKGYRQECTLVVDDEKKLFPECKGTLYRCLEGFMQAYMNSDGKDCDFRLYTYAYFKGEDDHIHCRFMGSFDQASGFQIKEVSLADGYSKQSRTFQIESNDKLPHKHSLDGLFPRPNLLEKVFKRKRRLR